MDMSEREHLESLRTSHERRLRRLETQAATNGSNTLPEIHMEIEDIRKEIRKINQELDSLLPPGAIFVDITSYPGHTNTDPTHITLDWAGFFDHQFPKPEEWANTLLPDLINLRDTLDQRASRLVALHIKGHISVGIAFGYMFCSTTDYQLWIRQKFGPKEEWWRSTIQPSETAPLVVKTNMLDGQGTDTSIELSVARDVSEEALEYIGTADLPIGQRISCSLAATPGTVRDAAHAVAQHVRQVIIKARSTHKKRPLHLFAAVPIGLAVLIGAQLNACGPIQCYEYNKEANEYVPACLLR